ncbi:Serine/threonine protein kinase [Asanoa hainanensis]|uniref:non-specific serine/threonine protein kinase n=1 Tax=Asanoa hainanensis TaxID=560556 RepID=A0A239K8V4_9ACTN|nr:serine/threonine-protein kinase [Asanoa hainanensis]SNT14039.1 Serine/threonine protein kinase [Asanoa hainanensis]
MSTLTPGALLARRYRLIDRVGAGGMSVIWRARDEVLDRTVAVKVLSSALAADARFRDLVRDEARAAAQLVHPHVATVHDYAETVAPDGTVTAFVVFELLTGEELEARLTEGPLPWPDAVRVCAEVAEALAAAHRLGIVHRDVTPANVMLTPTGAKVLDFGIATRVGAPDDDAEGETFGTPAYVAPERLDGTPAQPATDSYALGVLLHETLTGHVPVPADTWEDLTRAWSAGHSPAPPEVAGLPPAVAELCVRCLARDPLSRPTAHAAAAELRAAIAAPPPPPLPPLPPLPPPAPTPAPPPVEAPPRQSRLLVAAAIAAVLLLATAVLVPVLHEDGPPPGGSVTAQPTAPPPPATGPASTPAGPVSIGEALSRVDGLITEGQAVGGIRHDAATDLRNLLRELNAAETRTDRVNQLRAKVAVRAGEGAISRPYAERLDLALAGFPGA